MVKVSICRHRRSFILLSNFEFKNKKNKQSVPVNFGVSHRGIITYLHGTPASTARIELYPWSQIGKISFENKSLHIHAHTPEVNTF